VSEATFEARFSDGTYCIGTLEYVRQKVSEKYKAGVLMDHFGGVPDEPCAKSEGLVAPSSWSDSGGVPAGEVTYTYDNEPLMFASIAGPTVRYRFSDWKPPKPTDPNAKPSNPALCRVAGEAYRGLGWCDE
jgi:hypothetical protein